MSYILLITILALATIPALFFKSKAEVHGPICLWRTKRGLRFLNRQARHKFWTALADLGIIFCFGVFGAVYLFRDSKRTKKFSLALLLSYAIFIIAASLIALPGFLFGRNFPLEFVLSLFIGGLGSFVLVYLFSQTAAIISSYLVGKVPMPGIQPVLPGLEIPGAPVYIPFHAIIGLVVLIIVHELAHGIVLRREKLKVKSLGVLTSGIIPIGAFTEPDEAQLKRIKMRRRARVFSVGSMSNFVFGFIFLALFFCAQHAANPLFVQDPAAVFPSFIPFGEEYIDHILVTAVVNNSPAYFANLTVGTKIYNVDVVLTEPKPFEWVTLETDKGNIPIQRNATASLGFFLTFAKNEQNYGAGIWFQKYGLEIIYWVFVLNFLVGVINFLPFAIFDGARIFEDLIRFYFHVPRKKAHRVMIVLTCVILILLAINALPYFIR